MQRSLEKQKNFMLDCLFNHAFTKEWQVIAGGRGFLIVSEPWKHDTPVQWGNSPNEYVYKSWEVSTCRNEFLASVSTRNFFFALLEAQF